MHTVMRFVKVGVLERKWFKWVIAGVADMIPCFWDYIGPSVSLETVHSRKITANFRHFWNKQCFVYVHCILGQHAQGGEWADYLILILETVVLVLVLQ